MKIYNRTKNAIWYDNMGYWRIDIQRGGKRRTFYSSTPGRAGMAECNAKADAWLMNLRKGIIDDDSELNDLIPKWLEREKTATSSSAYAQYSSFARTHIAPCFEEKRVKDLCDGLLQGVLDSAASKGLSRKTISGIRGALLSFCKWCRKNKYTEYAPRDIETPASAPKPEPTIMSKDSIYRMLNDNFDDWYINFYRLAVLTGMRPGELVGLEWGDVHDDLIDIKRSINTLGEETRGKNDNARREIAQNELTREVLNCQMLMLQQNNINSEYVFCDTAGAMSQERYIYRRFKTFCRKNGFGDLTLYELRHTFISFNKAMPTGLLKATVGHSVNMQTYRTYSHEIDGDKRAAAEYSASVFNKIIHR